MTERDPRDDQPTSADPIREPQSPDPDERLHRYDPTDSHGTDPADQTASVPPVGTWHPAGGPVIPPPPAEETTAFGPFTFRQDDPRGTATVARDERRRGRNRSAGVLVGALLLGSAGGVV